MTDAVACDMKHRMQVAFPSCACEERLAISCGEDIRRRHRPRKFISWKELATMNRLRWIVSDLFLLIWLFCLCRQENSEQLYRLVDRNLGCESGSIISSFVGYSKSTCASACKTDSTCGMFAVQVSAGNESRTENSTARQLKGSSRQKCDLCKSTNMSATVEKEGWSIYMEWLKDAKYHVLETDNHSSLSNLPPQEMWSIDCNRPEVTDYRNGAIIGIWDDKDSFRDLDKVKCFNWGDGDILSEKQPRLLHIHLEDYRQCPKDYVLTAITASNAAFRNVDKGKCSPLAVGYHIDYDQCVTVTSENQDGGTTDKWRPWQVQCPNSGPHVAVSLHRRRRIHTGLKCCVIVNDSN